MLNEIQKYNKALVPVVMTGLYVVNQIWGWAVPSETEIQAAFGGIMALLVYLIPNKK